jgi:hypothetical protein
MKASFVDATREVIKAVSPAHANKNDPLIILQPF